MSPSQPSDVVYDPTAAAGLPAEHAGDERAAAQRARLPAAWRRVDRVIVRGTEWSLFAIGALFTLMITLEVISRFVFNFSIYFVNAAARMLLVWFFLLGAGVALRHGAHVGFELIVTVLRPSRRRSVIVFALALMLLFCAQMIWAGFYSFGPSLRQTEGGLGISLVWIVTAIPIGFALIAYHAIVLIYGELRMDVDEGRSR